MTAAGHARYRRDGRPTAPGPRRAGRSRVRPVAGVLLLVVVCALVVAEGRVRAGNREPVLALARPVTAGQVLTAADLQVVQVSVAGPASLLPASRLAQVAGRTAAAGLPAGSLLAAGDIGAASPGRGQAWLGVALGPGRYPPGLSPGQHVGVLAAPDMLAAALAAEPLETGVAAGRVGDGQMGDGRRVERPRIGTDTRHPARLIPAGPGRRGWPGTGWCCRSPPRCRARPGRR